VPITAQSDFFAAGGDSLLALGAVLEMETRFGIPIPLRLLFQARTPRALASRLSRHDTVPDFRYLVPLRAANASSGIPLFFVHGVRGDLFHLLPLILQLPAHIPVYGLQGDAETDLDRAFDQVAADYVKEIRTFQPRGPWFIAGFSLGGVLGHDIARRLNEESGQPVRLFLIDSYPRNLPAPGRLAMQILTAVTHVRHRLPGVLRHPGTLVKLPRALLGGRRRGTPTGMRMRNPFERSMRAVVPRPWFGDATLFLARGSSHALKFGWRYLIRNRIDVQLLQGTHGSLLREDLAELAMALAGRYDHHSQPWNEEDERRRQSVA
jgi:thioesterase domain-containing protein